MQPGREQLRTLSTSALSSSVSCHCTCGRNVRIMRVMDRHCAPTLHKAPSLSIVLLPTTTVQGAGESGAWVCQCPHLNAIARLYSDRFALNIHCHIFCVLNELLCAICRG